MKESLTIIKVGGAIIDDELKFEKFLTAFSAVQGKKILVHGGGKVATDLANSLGLEVKMINGRRITDDQMIDLVVMTYGGSINKKIVARLIAKGENAVGLTGADGDSIRSVKRPIKNGIDFGWVGDVIDVNVAFISDLLNQEIIPVMAPLTHDGEGNLLNTNADTIASELASALARRFEVSLNFVFDKKGVMKDISDPNSLIKSITATDYDQLKQNHVIADGMLPKLDNAFSTLSEGVEEVRLLNVSALKQLQNPDFDEYTTIH